MMKNLSATILVFGTLASAVIAPFAFAETDGTSSIPYRDAGAGRPGVFKVQAQGSAGVIKGNHGTDEASKGSVHVQILKEKAPAYDASSAGVLGISPDQNLFGANLQVTAEKTAKGETQVTSSGTEIIKGSISRNDDGVKASFRSWGVRYRSDSNLDQKYEVVGGLAIQKSFGKNEASTTTLTNRLPFQPGVSEKSTLFIGAGAEKYSQGDEHARAAIRVGLDYALQACQPLDSKDKNLLCVKVGVNPRFGSELSAAAHASGSYARLISDKKDKTYLFVEGQVEGEAIRGGLDGSDFPKSSKGGAFVNAGIASF